MFRYFIVSLIVFFVDVGWSTQKMDLDDVKIKGELHGDGRLKVIGRQETQIKDYVKFRRHYRSEIVEALPRPQPQIKYYGNKALQKN